MDILDNATLWVGISFIFFVLLVIKPISKLTNESLKVKIIEISKKIEDAENLKNEASVILSELKKEKETSEDSIKLLIEKAKEESRQIELDMKENLNDLVKKKESSLEQKLKYTKAKFEKEISEEILQSAINVTRKRIIKDLSESKKDALIEKSINEINLKVN